MRRVIRQANARVDRTHSVGERTAAGHDQQSACAPDLCEHAENAIALLDVLQQASPELDDEFDVHGSASSKRATAAAGA